MRDIESGVSVSAGSNVRRDEKVPDLFSTLEASIESEAAAKIRAVDLNTLTPIEAMNLLFEVKRMLEE